MSPIRTIKSSSHYGLPCSGINGSMLWAASVEAGFSGPPSMIYRQAQDLGAPVRKVEKGAAVCDAKARCYAVVRCMTKTLVDLNRQTADDPR
jgi:antirestriction protein ArdC